MHLPWRDVTIDGRSISTSLTPAETAELSRLAAGGEVLEIGSAFGYSTCLLARAANHVIAVDPQEDQGPLLANLAALGLADKVDIWPVTSTLAMNVMVAGDRRFDLIFVDGDHRYPAVTSDIAAALRLLRPGGVLACHDYHEISCPDVARALDEAFPAGPSRLVDTLFVVDR